jgi:hypothetical protein
MAKGFQKGDPRAKLAGKKGGLKSKHRSRDPLQWRAGRQAGWIACERFWLKLTADERAEKLRKIEESAV